MKIYMNHFILENFLSSLESEPCMFCSPISFILNLSLAAVLYSQKKMCIFIFYIDVFIPGAAEKVQTPLTEFLNKKKAAKIYSRQSAIILVVKFQCK